MKTLLSGNEAIARGAWEAGLVVAAAYPGTPSTEILENLADYPDIYCEWSPNEKVALEVASGASLAGVRALAVMKHVGLNVASDPFMTLSYTGVKGGMVVVVADDPELHSSQNEQDSRHYARMANVPVIEPSDSAEAREFVKAAFSISERFDTPVLLRTTTRVSHSRSTVPIPAKGSRRVPAAASIARDQRKFVMVPAYARLRHHDVLRRHDLLAAFGAKTKLNRIEPGKKALGIVTSGIAYQYVKEAFPDASILKLGFSYPLPERLIRRFAATVKRLVVVEELDPFLEEQIRALGIRAEGKSLLPLFGELNPAIVADALGPRRRRAKPVAGLPPRPPSLCPGCGHMAFFNMLRPHRPFVAGDIGCYTLAAAPPLEMIHTCLCMGGGISQAHGISKAFAGGEQKKTAAVIGDSTFLHSGLHALLNVGYNRGNVAVFILDNRTTAMTGRQEHPGTGKTIRGDEAPAVNCADLARALGISHVETVDPYDFAATRAAIARAMETPGPTVVVVQRPCLLLSKKKPGTVHAVDPAICIGCKRCLTVGCTALSFIGKGKSGKSVIDPVPCAGCGVCADACPQKAISPVKP
jgi:indolepyruvate ferredoxin oxidoreductase alpha subunit